MNRDFSTVQLRVDIAAEQINSMLALRADEVKAEMQEGVKRALRDASESIVKQAQDAAAEQIISEIKSYFSYGEGRDALRAAIAPTLAKITAQILKKGAT